jgi:hypothetical protein
MGFSLNFENEFKIDVTPEGTTSTFVPVAAGLKEASPSINDETDDTAYYDGEGFGETDVIGAQLVLALTFDRKDDPAQNFILGTSLEFGQGRRTNFEWTTPQGEKFEGEVTISNIELPGGEARAKGEWSCEMRFAGKPIYTPAPAGGAGE